MENDKRLGFISQVVSHAYDGQPKDEQVSWMRRNVYALQEWGKRNLRLVLWSLVLVNATSIVFAMVCMAYCTRLAWQRDNARKDAIVAYKGFSRLIAFTFVIEEKLAEDELHELNELRKLAVQDKRFQQAGAEE